jgi:Ca2+-binding RTX toxin-like protein
LNLGASSDVRPLKVLAKLAKSSGPGGKAMGSKSMRIRLVTAGAALAIALGAATAQGGMAWAADKVGTNGSESIIGTNGPDTIYALNGFDVLEGKRGNDELYAGKGPDEVYGGKSADYLVGGTG